MLYVIDNEAETCVNFATIDRAREQAAQGKDREIWEAPAGWWPTSGPNEPAAEKQTSVTRSDERAKQLREMIESLSSRHAPVTVEGADFAERRRAWLEAELAALAGDMKR